MSLLERIDTLLEINVVGWQLSLARYQRPESRRAAHQVQRDTAKVSAAGHGVKKCEQRGGKADHLIIGLTELLLGVLESTRRKRRDLRA